MVDQNGKDKGLRATMRERDDQDAQTQLDQFTVLQDVTGGDLKAQAYDVDPVSGEEEIVAGNPLLSINKTQDLLGGSLQDEILSEGRDVLFSEDSSSERPEAVSADDGNFASLSSDAVARSAALQGEAGDDDNSGVQASALEAGDAGDLFAVGAQDGSGAAVSEDFGAGDESNPVFIPEAETEDRIEDLAGDSDVAPEPLPINLNVRVSHATDHQDTINSVDGFDLVVNAYGAPQVVTGADMGISGVRDDAQITYIFHDENTVEVTLDTAWNSVKNIEVFSDVAGHVTLHNFVHTDVGLGDGGDSTVIINGAKRGNITTGDGDDRVEVNADTNNAGWSNDFAVRTGAGADVIEVTGDQGITGFNIDAGADDDRVIVGGAYDGAQVSLGRGDDVFKGGDGDDVVRGGSGDDVINGGAGDDVLDGGAGADVVKGGAGNDRIIGGDGDVLHGGAGNDVYVLKGDAGHVTIADFGGVGSGGYGETDMFPHHDTIKLEGAGLTAENMLLSYDGDHTIVTFEGVDGFQLTLADFDFTDLDNLPAVQGWNIIFDGQSEGTDAYDVFNDHGTRMHGLWNGDSVTHLNDADNVVHGFDGSDDVINAMEGNDTVSGGTGDDVLRGQSGDDVLYGDDPGDMGSSFVTTTLDVCFVSRNAAYKNSIGAYTVDGDGNILSVNVGIENANAASLNEKFSLETNGSEVSEVGYFIISNGYTKNKHFFDDYDSEDGTYSFVYKAGSAEERPANIADDADDVSIVFDTGDEVITLKGDVYHSYAGLNGDGHDHVVSSQNGDGSTRLGFEDLKNLGDADFDDVVLDVSVSSETVYDLPVKEGGDDRLVGGAGDDRLIGQGGDDVLEGGAGDDVAVFSGFHHEYDISFQEDGSIVIADTVEGRDGTDILSDVESVAFRDGDVAATPEALILPDGDAGAGAVVLDDVVEEDSGDDQDDNQSQDQGDEDNQQGNQGEDDGNNGHGNDADGVDESNPGQGGGGPNGNEHADTDDVEFFAFDSDGLDDGAQSWLSAVDAAEDERGVAVDLQADDDSWVADVDSSAGRDKADKNNNGKAKGKSKDGGDDVNGDDAVVDLADVMVDVVDQVGGVSGDLL